MDKEVIFKTHSFPGGPTSPGGTCDIQQFRSQKCGPDSFFAYDWIIVVSFTPFATLPRRLRLDHRWENSPQLARRGPTGAVLLRLSPVRRQAQACPQGQRPRSRGFLPQDQLATGFLAGRHTREQPQDGQLGRNPGLPLRRAASFPPARAHAAPGRRSGGTPALAGIRSQRRLPILRGSLPVPASRAWPTALARLAGTMARGRWKSMGDRDLLIISTFLQTRR